MTKLIYLLWPGTELDPAERRRVLMDECAPQLVAAGAAGVQMNIADDQATVPSPAPKPPFKTPFVAQVNLWTEDASAHRAFEEILRASEGDGPRFKPAGYRVDEWLYTEYGDNAHGSPRDWPDGTRSPGILAVTQLVRPRRVSRDEWMRRWFGRQSPVSEWMQPRARYVRNVVEEALTPEAPHCDGIVEEAWPSGEHVTNPYLFYTARNRLELMRNMALMLRSVTGILNLWNITTVMTSEYFVKTRH